MPMIIPAAIGLAATIGAYALLPATVMGLSATFVAGIIGTIVSTAASFLMASMTRPKPAAAPRPEDRRQSVRGAIEPRRVVYGHARVGGAMVYVASAGLDLEDLHVVVVLAGHPCHAVQTVWINDVAVPTSTLAGDGEITDASHALRDHANIRIYLGTQTAADPILTAAFPGVWTAEHLLSGCTYLAIRLRYSRDTFPSGLQNISAELSGKSDIHDPRSNTTGYTANWALCVHDYLRGAHGLACAADEVDLGTIIAAANLSDEAVPLNEAGTVTEPRYRVDGAFTLDQAPIEIMEGLLSAGAGTIVYVQGQYRLYGGAYAAPSLALTPSDFAGDIRLETRPPRRDVFNAVRGTFVDPARNWQPSEFPPMLFPAFETEDGERIWRDLRLPFTVGASNAQRLARIAALTARDSLSFTAPMRYAALRLAAWQMVAVTHPDFGWTDKPFRVNAWRFDPASGEITVSFREENAANYAWIHEMAAAIPPHPNTTLVDPLDIPAPTDLAVQPGATLQPDGSLRPVLDVTWNSAAHPFVTSHELQWRLPGGEWSSVMVPRS